MLVEVVEGMGASDVPILLILEGNEYEVGIRLGCKCQHPLQPTHHMVAIDASE